MFDLLSQKLTGILSKLTGRGLLTEDDIAKAMREIRIVLLEADVALPVVKSFIEKISKLAVGQEILQSITPAQMIIKIVHDALIELLGETPQISLSHIPHIFLLVGLQGSGKTTFAGKLATYIQKNFSNKKVLVESLDVYRPAAREQLDILIKTTNAVYSGHSSLDPIEIASNALHRAKKEGFDVLILDTAGRLEVDEMMMEELEKVISIVKPNDIYFVADSLIGQAAYTVAKTFKEKAPLTGVVLSRVDGDGRGGAALSIRHVTEVPICFLSVGEKLHELEAFDAKRIADRILDKGDVLGFIEKIQDNIDQEESEKLAKRMEKGIFNLNDLEKQLVMMKKMGGMTNILGMIPGLGKLKNKISESGQTDKILQHQVGIIRSMTKKERADPKLLNSSRKRRVAEGSGTEVQDVNRLLKQFQDMDTMMKRMKKVGMGNMMRSGFKDMFNSNKKG
jgi:signal recognition particle subunit SRP54